MSAPRATSAPSPRTSVRRFVQVERSKFQQGASPKAVIVRHHRRLRTPVLVRAATARLTAAVTVTTSAPIMAIVALTTPRLVSGFGQGSSSLLGRRNSDEIVLLLFVTILRNTNYIPEFRLECARVRFLVRRDRFIFTLLTRGWVCPIEIRCF